MALELIDFFLRNILTASLETMKDELLTTQIRHSILTKKIRQFSINTLLLLLTQKNIMLPLPEELPMWYTVEPNEERGWTPKTSDIVDKPENQEVINAWKETFEQKKSNANY
jgi:hypothetical protein